MRALLSMAAGFAALEAMGMGRERGIDPNSINAGNNLNPHMPKGLREFYIDGYTVYAINEKNARKKVTKLKERDK